MSAEDDHTLSSSLNTTLQMLIISCSGHVVHRFWPPVHMCRQKQHVLFLAPSRSQQTCTTAVFFAALTDLSQQTEAMSDSRVRVMSRSVVASVQQMFYGALSFYLHQQQ